MDTYDRTGYGRHESRRTPGDYYVPRSRFEDEAWRHYVPDYRERRPRRDRERSRSPPGHIDRYAPGRDRYEDRGLNDRPERMGDRRRRSPPAAIDRYVPNAQNDQKDAPAFNPLTNPMKLPYQVGFNYFAEWWRQEKFVKEEQERQKNGGRRPDRLKGEKEVTEERARERELIQDAYNEYKEKLNAQMARDFVDQHKNDEWFKERYHPEIRAPVRATLSEARQGAFKKWEQDLQAGVFDEFTLEGIYKSESNGVGGVVEKEEGEAAAANEVLGVGDLVPVRGGDLRDESAMQPTLLIKTIAPTVSRAKMEEFCKEHLGEGDGGFRGLSLSDPNPQKKFHRIGWVILNPAGETMEIDERIDPRDAGVTEGEEGEDEIKLDTDNETNKPASVAEKGLEAINGKTIQDEIRGSFTCHVGIHEPPSQPRKKALWDLFSAPERVERDLHFATRLVGKLDAELGDGFDGVSKVEERVEDLRGKGWLQPPVNALTSKKQTNIDEMDEDEEGAVDDDDDEEGAIDEENDDEDLLAQKKRLDLLVEYLRRVHNFCMFCVFESDSVHELTRKCPGGHLRRPRASLTSSAKTAARASANGEAFPYKNKDKSNEGDEPGSPDQQRKYKGIDKVQQQLERAFKWVKTYEEKLLQVLDPDSIDIKKLGGKPADEALEDELEKYVKQEDENKFRCKVPECTKLFKGQNFWRKHIEKRHEEFFSKIKFDVSLINAYVLDPSHIAPSKTDATSNGHFPIKDSQGPMGTPRGFNLANMGPGFPPFGGPGGPPNAANFMHLASLMASNGQGPAMNMFNGQGQGYGAVRRNRPNTGTRMEGPYDRQGGRDQRNQRWGRENNGRLTPPGARGGGIGRPTGPPRFGEGGAGPREAVQGRVIKTYEDLDAADTAGPAELDY